MSALIAIGWRLAGQQVQAVQTQLTPARIQSDYITHAEIRFGSIRRALADEAVITQGQLLILDICIQCTISANKRGSSEIKIKEPED